MKRITFLVFGFFVAARLCAQFAVQGRVVEQTTHAPVSYVTLSVLTPDSALLTGAVTDESGIYSLSLPQGNYILQASFVGYATVSCPLSVTGKSNVPDLFLREETEHIAEVEVHARKPLIERQMDKIVFNVSQSPLAAGTNGKELLKKAPGVYVDKDGNVTYNGKSVEVYIDDRPSYLSGDQLRAMLEGTDGSTIERIELIGNPGAKYDASGTGGIINIRLKRNKTKGLNGVLNATYAGMYFKSIDRYLNYEFVNLNLNYRTDKTYTYTQLTQGIATHATTLTTVSRRPDMNQESVSEYSARFQNYMLKVGNDWYIDSLNTFGFFVQVPLFYLNHHAPADKGYSWTEWYDETGQLSSRMRSRTEINNDVAVPQHTANLNYTHIFSETLQRELTVNMDYNRHNSQSVNTQYNERFWELTPPVQDYIGLDINTRQIANIFSAKLDFQTRFWKTGMIETGAKYTVSTMDSRMTTDSLLGTSFDTWHTLSSTPSDFDYTEHVAALYIALGKQFGEHWNVKLGLRGEYTYSVGDWVSADSVSRKSYFNLFPTVFFGYMSSPLGKLQQTVSVNAGYTRRIKRPNYNILNPFRTYVDAHSYSVGNTGLTPEFNNDVEISFGYSRYLNLTFNFSHTQDMFSQQVTILPNGDGQQIWLNFGTCTTHGGNLALTELPLVPKFDDRHKVNGAWLALTVNFGYFNFLNQSYAKNGDGSPVYRNQNDFFRFNGAMNAYLPKDWSLSLDGWYASPMTIGYNRQTATYGMSCGVRKVLPDKGLVLNLQLQDMLRSSVYHSDSQGLPEGQSVSFENNWYGQRVTFSLTYMFGQQQGHKWRKVGDSEFNDRLSSSNAISQ